LLQALVDADCKLIDVDIGAVGRQKWQRKFYIILAI
jgi:hypothetical protein